MTLLFQGITVVVKDTWVAFKFAEVLKRKLGSYESSNLAALLSYCDSDDSTDSDHSDNDTVQEGYEGMRRNTNRAFLFSRTVENIVGISILKS